MNTTLLLRWYKKVFLERRKIQLHIFFCFYSAKIQMVMQGKKELERVYILEAFAHFFTDPEIYSLSTPF